jgi:hypothetical protein
MATLREVLPEKFAVVLIGSGKRKAYHDAKRAASVQDFR